MRQYSISALAAMLLFSVTSNGQSLSERFKSASQDWKFWTGVVSLQAGAIADASTSRSLIRRGGIESNPFLRDEQGKFRSGRHLALWSGLNAAFLPADFSRDKRYRWVSFGARVGLSVFLFRAAGHNRGVGR
jgi:hypothetical protein